MVVGHRCRRTAWFLCLLACACSGPHRAEQGVVRIGWAGSPDSMNPGVAMLSEAYVVFDLLYDTLFRQDLDGTFVPELAERWSVTPDGRVWTFRIRSGARFHDGQPLTARDVAFSLALYQAHEDFPLLHSYTRPFETVRALDDQTIEVRLGQPVPNMESRLVFLYVLPEHVWREHAGEDAAQFANAQAIGSGPFRLVEYRQSEFVHLAANRQHASLAPHIDRVVFQTYANQDALVQAIRTGQVDAITEMPYPAVRALRREPHVQVTSGVPMPPSIVDIALNQMDPQACPEGGTCSGHPALRDRVVRQALALATDKAQLIDVAVLGLGTPGLTLIPDSLAGWYDTQLTDYPYDVAAANGLLDQAGYADTDGDGVRQMPGGGRPLVFRVTRPSDSTVSPRMAEMLAAMWARVGVQAELRSVDPDALTAACCPAFDYDVILWGWDSDPDPDLLLGVMTSAEIPTGGNETGYANPQYDSLYARQSRTLDLTQRRALVWQMQELAHRDVVYIVPYNERVVQAFRTDRFSGWMANAPRVALQHPRSLAALVPLP